MNIITLYVLKISGKIFEYHLKNHLHFPKGEVKQSPRLTSLNDKYTRKNLRTCTRSANKPSTSCVRTACYKLSTSLEQAVNNL